MSQARVAVPGGARGARGERSRRRATLVLRALRGAIEALQHQDIELADEVIAVRRRDRRALPRGSRRSSAAARAPRRRSRPTCGCSRAAARRCTLERMGDQCVNIAKLTKLVGRARRRATIWSRASTRWASAPRRWCAIALDALRGRATSSRRADLVEHDELIDRANRRVFDQVLEIGERRPTRASGR